MTDVTATHEIGAVTTATKAWVGLGIAVVGEGLTTASLYLPVNGEAHVIIAIALAMLTPLATAFGVYQTTNKPV